jgi:hypothetical protein
MSKVRTLEMNPKTRRSSRPFPGEPPGRCLVAVRQNQVENYDSRAIIVFSTGSLSKSRSQERHSCSG